MSVIEATFVALVLLVMLSLLFVGWKTPEVVVFLALVLVWNVGTISTEDALSGFSNPGVLAVGSLFVVIKGVERSRLADKAAKHVFGLRTSFAGGLLRLMGVAFVMSAFLNNTPVVALLIPITRDWALTRGFSPSLLLMPLSFACIFGGLVTIMGTSTNLVVQGLVIEAGKDDPSIRGLGFFEPGLIGLPLGLVGILYIVMVAPRVLPRTDGGAVGSTQDAEEFLTEVQVMHNFPYVGQPVTVVLAQLGLAAETLLTVRRKHPMGASSGHEVSLSETRSQLLRREGLQELPSPDRVSSAGEITSGSFGGGGGRTPRRRNVSTSTSVKPVCLKRLGGALDQNKEQSPRQRLSASLSAARSPSTESPFVISNTEPIATGSSGISPGSDHRTRDDTLCQSDGDGATGSNADVPSVALSELVGEGTTLHLRCSRLSAMSFLGSAVSEGLEGLRILGTNVRHLQVEGSEILELVLSGNDRFVGKCPAGEGSASLADYYGCRVVAVRPASCTIFTSATRSRKEEFLPAAGRQLRFQKVGGYSSVEQADEATVEDSVDFSVERQVPIGLSLDSPGAVESCDRLGANVAREILAPGDTLMVLARQGFVKRWKASQEFDLVTKIGSVPASVRAYDYFSILVFCGMLGWVLVSEVSMVRAAFVAGGILMVGGWVDPRKAVDYVDWALLLLVGSALGLSKAITNSGLAGYAGEAIRKSGMSASASIYVLFGFTMICTELITNNAAAALAVPIALSIAKELEVNYKPFVLTVMMAASSSFMTPIGYQTNTMVWAPGGYKFSDFIKLGTPLSLIFLVVGSTLLPRLFPF